MSERNYWVLSDDNCKFEGMTKEQIISAIAEATGATPTHIDDAFITKIKEQNGSTPIKLWVGTQAAYNQQTPEDNTVYLIEDIDNTEFEGVAIDPFHPSQYPKVHYKLDTNGNFEFWGNHEYNLDFDTSMCGGKIYVDETLKSISLTSSYITSYLPENFTISTVDYASVTGEAQSGGTGVYTNIHILKIENGTLYFEPSTFEATNNVTVKIYFDVKGTYTTEV